MFHLIKFMCCEDISQIHERPRSSPALKRLKIDEFYRVQQHLQRPQCIPFRGTERSPRLAPLHSGSGMAVQMLLNSLDSIYSFRGKSTMAQKAQLVSLVASGIWACECMSFLRRVVISILVSWVCHLRPPSLTPPPYMFVKKL